MTDLAQALEHKDSERTRAALEHHVRRSLDSLREALGSYVALVYRLDDAATTHWSAESRPISPSGGSGWTSPRMAKDPQLDAFLKRDVRRDIDGLVRAVDRCGQNIAEVLRDGQPRRRARLSSEQTTEIRELGGKGVSGPVLAAQYGVHPRTIDRVLRRE